MVERVQEYGRHSNTQGDRFSVSDTTVPGREYYTTLVLHVNRSNRTPPVTCHVPDWVGGVGLVSHRGFPPCTPCVEDCPVASLT